MTVEACKAILRISFAIIRHGSTVVTFAEVARGISENGGDSIIFLVEHFLLHGC